MNCKKVLFWVGTAGSIIATGIGMSNPISLLCGLVGGVVTATYGCFLDWEDTPRSGVLETKENLDLIAMGTAITIVNHGINKSKLDSALSSKVLAYSFESIKDCGRSGKATIVVEEPSERLGIDKPGIYMKTVAWNRAVR